MRWVGLRRRSRLADVIRAVEGPIATVRGVRPDDVEYDGPARALAPVWLELRAAMRGVLEETTLAEPSSSARSRRIDDGVPEQATRVLANTRSRSARTQTI